MLQGTSIANLPLANICEVKQQSKHNGCLNMTHKQRISVALCIIDLNTPMQYQHCEIEEVVNT